MVRILKEDVFLGDVTGELRPPLSTQDQNMEVSNHRDKENNNCCSNNIDNFNTSQGERERADSPELRNGGGGPGEDFDEVMSTDSIVSSEGGGFTFRVPIIIVGDFEEEEEESEEDSEDNHESNSQEVRKRKLIPPTVVIQNVDDEQSTRFNEYIEEMNPEGGGRDEETGKGEIMTSIEQETIKPPQEQENVICSHANVVTQDSSTKSLETNNEGKIDPVEKSMDEQGDHHDDKDKESEEDCAHAAKDSKEPETPISSTTSSLSSVSNSSRAAVSPLSSSKGSSSSSSHGQARFNRGHHHQHHCPAFHRSMHLPPNNQVPQVVPNIHFMMTQAHQSAMNHLINQTPFQHSSNFQNFPLLPNPPVSVQPPPPPPPLPPHSQQHGGGPFILGPPPNFSRNCPHHQNRPPLLNHNIIKPLPPPQTKYQPRHNHHPSQNRASLIQRQNINPMMNTAVPMHLFGEPEIPPWGGSFPNSNNRPPPPPSQPPSQIPSLPPLDIQGSSGTLPLIGSLPTAIIPLPLDRNFPPVVLPSYPNNTNTPNTQSTSGYSTAGHSRSSSPMGPTVNHGHGLLQHFDNGLLPLPPPPPNSQQANGCTNLVFSAPFQEHAMYPQFFPHSNGQFVVYFHINLGVSVSFTTGDQSQVVKGQ